MTFDEYVQHHYGFFETLLLQITLQCPLQCEHCNVNSGPNQISALTPNDIENTIREFAKTENAKMVFITGGEPFSAYSQLKQALDSSEKLGLSNHVITSASWAKSIDLARSQIERLPPIELISISVDQWHSKFLSMQHIKNAVQAGLESGSEVNLAITLKGSNDPFSQLVKDELKEFLNEVSIYECMVIQSGRSIWDCNERTNEKIPMGYCPKIGAPTVTSDG